MKESTANNKRIAKNTMFLYLRMGISMLVALFTSRVVLQNLGVEDYGTYGVIGGVVAMFDFLNASMSGATSRFLTYELGRGEGHELSKTFSMAFFEHAIIAIIILLICETFGIWLLNNKLVIPPERMVAANWVFQLSLLSMMVTITQVPYNASIISHEKMDIYAYVEMAYVGLKLLAVYLLAVLSFDKLILYATLMLILSAGRAMFYRVYCARHYVECKIRLIWDTSLLKRMLTFSGWDLYGNMSVMARTEGVTLLLNIFFGPVVNAASSIATQVQGSVMKFATSVSTAVKPQIIKYYAQGKMKEMIGLMSNAIRLNFFILLFPTVPLIVSLPYVLQLWLGVVPEHTVIFCTLTLIFNFFANMSGTLVTGIHATGKNIRPSLINGSLYILVIPVSYVAFRLHADAWWPFLVNVIAVVLGMLSNAYTMNLYIQEFSVINFIKRDLIPCVMVFAACTGACLLLKPLLHDNFWGLIEMVIASSVLLVILGYYFLVPKSISNTIVNRLKTMVCKKG